MKGRCYRCFFFFQAEDGIRDVAVTGVQTCALPIYSPERTISSPSGPKITSKTCTSNFSAASTSSSAACWVVLNIFAFTPADTGVALAADCCLATIACADKKRNRPVIATAAGRILRLSFPRTRFISCSQLFFTMNAAYLRRPPPPRPPPPRMPPLRDPMLEAPRLLFARALDPLYPREPLDPPPNASRLPAPPRVRSRPPMLFGPPPLSLLPAPSPPPAWLPSRPSPARLLARLPP